MTTTPTRSPNPWKLSIEEKKGLKSDQIMEKTIQQKTEFEKNLTKFLGNDLEMIELGEKIVKITLVIKQINDDKDLSQDAKDKLITKRRKTLNELLQSQKNMKLSAEEINQIKNYMQKKVYQIDEMLSVNIPVYSKNAELATKSIEEYQNEIKDIEGKIAQTTEDDIKDAYTQTLTKIQKALAQAKGLKEGRENLKNTGTIHGISSEDLKKTRSDVNREMIKHGRNRYIVEGGKFVDTKNNNKEINNLQEFDTKFQKHDNYTITFSNENIALINLNHDNDRSYVMDLHTMKFVGIHSNAKNTKTTIGSKKLYKVYLDRDYYLLDITTGEKFPNILQECDDGFTVKQFDTVSLVMGFITGPQNDKYLILYDYASLEKIGENTYPPYGNLTKVSDLQDENVARGRREYILTSANKNNGEISVNELAGYTLIDGLRTNYVSEFKEIVFGLVKDEDFANPVYFVDNSLGKGKTIFRSESGDLLVLGSNHRNSNGGVFNIKYNKWVIPPEEAMINTHKSGSNTEYYNNVNIVIDEKNSLVLYKNGNVEKISGKIIECVLDNTGMCSLLITEDAVWKITDNSKPNEPMLKKLEYTITGKSIEILNNENINTFDDISSCVVLSACRDKKNGYILIDKNTGELIYKTFFDFFKKVSPTGDGKFTFIEKGLFGSKKNVG